MNADDIKISEIINMDIEEIDNLVKTGISIPICEDVIYKYVNLEDINLYRMYIENLTFNNIYLKEIIESKRCKKYDEIFKNISDKGLIDEHNSIFEDIINGREIKTDDINLVMGLCGSHQDILNFLQHESTDKLHRVLIDRYFKDNAYNFMLNLEMIINFVNSINAHLIAPNRLELYKKIYNFYNLSFEDKINLYNNMNNGSNYVEAFYDDYMTCRKFAYSMYNDKVLKVKNMKKSDLSSLYNVDVYELDGDDFTAFVHQTKIDRKTGNSNVWNSVDERSHSVKSFSMINQHHFDTIYGYDSYVVLGFSNLDIDRIIHVYHSDSFTDVNRGSDRVNEIFSPDMLMSNTMGYNEILYLKNNLSIMNDSGNHPKLYPSYIMCYDYVTDLEINIAKKYEIPIVLLHTDKYQNISSTIDYKNDVYLEDYNNKKKK